MNTFILIDNSGFKSFHACHLCPPSDVREWTKPCDATVPMFSAKLAKENGWILNDGRWVCKSCAALYLGEHYGISS